MNNSMNDDYAIDLAQYYGASFSGSDNASTSINYHPNLPSLEQIASYNLQNARAEAARQSAMNNQTQQGMSSSSMGSSGTSGSQMLTAPGTGASSYPTNDNSMNMGTASSSGTNMTQTSSSQPILEYNQPYPITAESIQYLNGFIRSQIGRNVSIEFLVGTNQLVTKDGFLLAVGANFILLNPKGTDDILACDFYNIKFITFYY